MKQEVLLSLLHGKGPENHAACKSTQLMSGRAGFQPRSARFPTPYTIFFSFLNQTEVCGFCLKYPLSEPVLKRTKPRGKPGQAQSSDRARTSFYWGRVLLRGPVSSTGAPDWPVTCVRNPGHLETDLISPQRAREEELGKGLSPCAPRPQTWTNVGFRKALCLGPHYLPKAHKDRA